MGPPQIISEHFHPSERARSRWLRQEIKNVELFLPFMRTTGGRESKPSMASGACTCTPGRAWPWTLLAAPLGVTPAAAHAAGLVIPAFISAAAIFCCCVISEVFG